MPNKFISSNLVVDLSTEEQQLLSGGQGTETPLSDGQPTSGGQTPYGGQQTYPSGGYGSKRYPTYICRPVYDSNDGGGYGNQ
ncbi:MAG: hypothetical protein KAF91_12290 [Nostoc sp. TH1S01]|nr:hypothetical protein [Nostoc sp. TH1S01]